MKGVVEGYTNTSLSYVYHEETRAVRDPDPATERSSHLQEACHLF